MSLSPCRDCICCLLFADWMKQAIATMSSNDSGPSCLMSRNQRKGGVAQGGLMMRPAR